MIEAQDSKFYRFMVHSWIKYQKFKGASQICAILLNFFILVFKMVFCGVMFILTLPHLAAHNLRNKSPLSAPKKLLYVLLVIVSITVDIPLMFLTLVGVVGFIEFIKDGLVVPALIFGVIAVVVGTLTIYFVKSLFLKSANTDTTEDDEDDIEEEPNDPVEEDIDDDIEELPFCQLFNISDEMCLLVDHIEMCPDETAFIRVVDDEGYTPLYKRKVRRDKEGNRFIVFNGTNHYLKDEKTQPVITKK